MTNANISKDLRNLYDLSRLVCDQKYNFKKKSSVIEVFYQPKFGPLLQSELIIKKKKPKLSTSIFALPSDGWIIRNSSELLKELNRIERISRFKKSPLIGHTTRNPVYGRIYRKNKKDHNNNGKHFQIIVSVSKNKNIPKPIILPHRLPQSSILDMSNHSSIFGQKNLEYAYWIKSIPHLRDFKEDLITKNDPNGMRNFLLESILDGTIFDQIDLDKNEKDYITFNNELDKFISNEIINLLLFLLTHED